ncbi:MAG: pseudaminic acid cytidylyltransferase [Halocynthiibacter sp.]
MSNICLIPARGGSKRIPRKNIKPFEGKPMIAWSIEAAKASGLFSRIIVSTDDPDIATTARDYGAETPFMRPPEIADDHATTVDVVRHALDGLGTDIEALCCLYATAPFVRATDIQAARLLLTGEKVFSMPVTTFPFPIQRAVAITPDGGLQMFNPKEAQTRSQDLNEAYHDVGQFYWGTPDAWRSDIPIFGPKTAPLIIPRWRAQDIDTTEDWTRAEALFRAIKDS